MCGICLLIRQKLANVSEAASSSQLHASGDGTHGCMFEPNPFYPPSMPPSSPSATEEQRALHKYAQEAATSANTHGLTPCVCSQPGLDVRSFLSGAEAANAIFSETIRNLRRRGPDTYGVTRRSFVTSCSAPSEWRELLHADGTVAHATTEDVCGKPPAASVKSQPSNFSLHSSPVAAASATHTGEDVMTLRTEVAGVASVLGLRGHSTVAQPYDMNVAVDAAEDRQTSSWDHRSSLMWNGEIFGGALCPPPWGSDTVLLAGKLSQIELECVRLTADDDDTSGTKLLPLVERQRRFLHRCTTLFEQQVEGPFSFIFIATRLQLALFGRDPLGRHSLLSHVRVTGPPAIAGATASKELDVELIVSSVGAQHHHGADCCGCNAASRRSSRPAAAVEAHPFTGAEATLLSNSSTLRHTARTDTASPEPSRGGHAKRPRREWKVGGDAALNSEQGAAVTGVETGHGVEEDDDELGGNATATSGSDVCWQEVGVTGLFAVPLQAPLVYRRKRSGGENEGEGENDEGNEEDPTHHHPVCVSSEVVGAHVDDDDDGATNSSSDASTVPDAYVLLLHCPWQRTHHLVHPLLRTATLPMIPHEAPPFELILAHEEIAVLPEPLLRWASHLMKSMQPDGGLEQSWVDWAAAHYMLALAVSMHRRITVANSGAADARDAQELSTARRRPLCILFSGGIDCTVIAALAHYLLPAETPIELVNVAFGEHPEQAPDRIAAFRSMEELLRLPLLSTSRSADAIAVDSGANRPEREWRLVLVDVPSKATSHASHIKDLLVPRHTVMDLDIGTALWYAARAAGRVQILKRSDVVDGTGSMLNGGSFDGTPPITNSGSSTSISVSPARGNGGASGSPTVTLDGFSKHFRAYTNAQVPSATTATTAPHPANGNWEGHATAIATAAAAADPAFSNTTIINSSPFFPLANGSNGAAPGSHTVGTASFTAAALPVMPSPEEVANTQKYQILLDILVKEGRSGTGPHTPVLLSTLGKEYSLFLQSHTKRYGYKKLGSFLNDAAKAGYVKFVADAPSKAVRLCRPCDMERAAAVPPSPWFLTRCMKGQEPMRGADGTVKPPLPCPGTYHEAYVSHAKVVLLGMGADETLGGYTRYRRFFQREGMPGARRELECDFARLWQRNLGRDDRVTMDSGREPRFPFLDEGVLRTLEWIVLKRRNNILTAQVQQQPQQPLLRHAHRSRGSPLHNTSAVSVSAAGGAGAGATDLCAAETEAVNSSTSSSSMSLPSAHRSSNPSGRATSINTASLTRDEVLRMSLEPIVSFRLNPGEGDKRVLRRVAGVLGLGDVTRLQKRAIQFGSRIAERKIKGTTEFD